MFQGVHPFKEFIPDSSPYDMVETEGQGKEATHREAYRVRRLSVPGDSGTPEGQLGS